MAILLTIWRIFGGGFGFIFALGRRYPMIALCVALAIGGYTWGNYQNHIGYTSGYAQARTEDRAASKAQEEALQKINGVTQRQLADAQIAFQKQHKADQDELAKLQAEVVASGGGDPVVWSDGVMQHYRSIWQGGR